MQRSPGLRILRIEDVDLGSGPLEWLCKGLRGHKVGVFRKFVQSLIVLLKGNPSFAADRCSLGACWLQDDAERAGTKHLSHRDEPGDVDVVV